MSTGLHTALRRLLLISLFPVLFLSANVAAEDDSAIVIAESAAARLTVGDFQVEMARLAPPLRAEFAANLLRLRQYLDNLFMTRALAAEARAKGLGKDTKVSTESGLDADRKLAEARVEQIESEAVAAFERDHANYVRRAHELYLVNIERYSIPTRIRVAHILVKVTNQGPEVALRKAEEIRSKIIAGQDFAAAAREFSDDRATANAGGELGYFEAKGADPAFAAAAFSLKNPGDVSEPVRSRAGYHLIYLEDRRPGFTRPFDEVQPELLEQLKQHVQKEARAAAQRRIFSDPTLHVNTEIIEKIHMEAAATVATNSRKPAAMPPASPK